MVQNLTTEVVYMFDYLKTDECSIQKVESDSLYGDLIFSSPVIFKCKCREERVFDYSTSSFTVTSRKVYKICSEELKGESIPVGSRIDSDFTVRSARMYYGVGGEPYFLKLIAE